MIKHLTPRNKEELKDKYDTLSYLEKQQYLFDVISRDSVEIELFKNDSKILEERKNISFCPLSWAILWKSPKAIKTILDTGIDINTTLSEFGKQMMNDVLKESENDKTPNTKI